MHKITEQHIIDYYYEADIMCFFNKTTLQMVHYGNKHVLKNEYNRCINYNKCINYITYPMDLMSTYNILKCRDIYIYKLNFAKNYILTILLSKKTILYAKGKFLHINIYEWLKYNMMTMGIIVKHDHKAIDMYNILENYIKEYL